MKKALIVHGVYGTPKENWFPWLKKELEKIGFEVIVPQLPTPEGHNLKKWLKVWQKYKSELDEKTILIGHSMGATFLLSVLENLEKPIKATFLIAGFASPTGVDPEIDELNKSFTDKSFDWGKIKQNCQKFYIFQSDNDHYVSFKKAQELSDNLETKITLVKNAGHFNKVAGYIKFELLLDTIKEIYG